jgi:hypothetical protein
MNLEDLLKRLNEDVKANPKLLSYQVRVAQYDPSPFGDVAADSITILPGVIGRDSIIVIG